MQSKKFMSLSGVAVACLMALSAPAFAADDMDVSLKDGSLKIKSGKNEFTVGGRIQADYVQYDEDFLAGANAKVPGTETSPTAYQRVAAEGYDDGMDTRRLRLGIAAKIGEDWEFKFEHDFKSKTTTDMFLKYKAWGPTITVGQFYGALGMEEQSSSRWISYMERSMATNAFAAPFSRRQGLGINGTFADQFMYAGALQFDTIDSAEENDHSDLKKNGATNPGDDPLVYTATLGWAPMNKDADKQLFLGVAFGMQDLEDSESTSASFSSRADLRIDGTPTIIGLDDGVKITTNSDGSKTAALNSVSADSFTVVNPQVAFIYGPFSASAEYFDVSVDRPTGKKDRDFDGYYVEGSWFITGEHRVFKWKDGKFDRPNISKNAWEVAVRHSNLDLTDGAVPADLTAAGLNSVMSKAGEADSTTVALNFYPNRTYKFSLDYTQAEVDYVGARPDEDISAVGLRAQVSW
ncbi:MAG: hypothetical protein HYV16_12330 [Gammaproteobacteria bacterium]|nr:hypothetical protein [Gammaproteobacteria bacterium]